METFPNNKKRRNSFMNLLSFLSLSAISSLMILGATNPKAQVKATGMYEDYIPMESSFFTNWKEEAGSFADKNATFWNEHYSFQAMDTFFRGETNEAWTGTLTSRAWKQKTQYVYFTFGGAKNYGEGEHVHLKFHFGNYEQDFDNDTFVENPMTLRYFKIPDDKFKELTKDGADFDMSVDIVDPATKDYGFANFGYLHVNQSADSTSDAMRLYLNSLSTGSSEWEINKRKQIQDSYFDNAYQREVFLKTVDNVDESFSSNDDFLKHWYFDYNFFNNNYATPRHFDKIISTNPCRPGADSNMPFNNEGGFFRGWYEPSQESGFVYSDGLRYRFVSRPFVLKETGLISIKMAGKASLHVIDSTVKNDGNTADLAWIDNKAFSDAGSISNIAESGFNTVTMVNHVINLEAYLGKTIQLAISDIDNAGWSAAYFDSLITNYKERPGFKIETATQTNDTGTFYPIYRDIYINSTLFKADTNKLGVIYNADNATNKANENAILNHVDTSSSLEAYNFFNSYLDYARQNELGTNLCSLLQSDEMKNLVTRYQVLSSDAQKIVYSSSDYQRYGAIKDNWYSIPVTLMNLGENLNYIARSQNNSIPVFGNGLFGNNSSSIDTSLFIVIAASSLVAVTAFTLFIRNKKRKNNN